MTTHIATDKESKTNSHVSDTPCKEIHSPKLKYVITPGSTKKLNQAALKESKTQSAIKKLLTIIQPFFPM